MFSHGYFGETYFGPRYFGAGGSALDRLLADTSAEFVFTAEISPWSIPAQATTTVCVATREFATAPTDALANTRFKGVLRVPLKFRRSIVGTDSIGTFTTGDGSLEFSNTDGSFDYLIGDYTIDGREIVVKVGRLTDSYDDYQVIFKGTAADWFIDDVSVKIVLRDYAYKLNVPVQSNVYGGTGGSDGGAALAGKKKPRAFGFVGNVSPPLVEPASLIYQTNDGPINSIANVYDRGVALTPDANYATYAALQAAVIPAGSYARCSAFGYFRLSSTPSGTVTADAFGYIGEDAAGIIRLIIPLSTSLNDPNDLYVPSFDLLEALQSWRDGYQIGYWCGTDSNETVADVFANIMKGAGGWAGFRRNGLLEASIFVAPAGGQVASYKINDGNLIDVKRDPLPSGMSPPPYRWRVSYGRNYTVQNDLAAAAGTSQIAFAAEEVRTAVASDTSVQTNYLFAQDPPPTPSYYYSSGQASDEAIRRLMLYGTKRTLYRVTLGVVVAGAFGALNGPPILDENGVAILDENGLPILDDGGVTAAASTLNWIGLSHNIGEVIQLTYPRWDLTNGKLLTIVEMNDDLENNTVELLCYG